MPRKKLTKAQANRLLKSAMAKIKKAWIGANSQYWFPGSKIISIEKEINTILSRNK